MVLVSFSYISVCAVRTYLTGPNPLAEFGESGLTGNLLFAVCYQEFGDPLWSFQAG